jgi:hypothetical protein
MDEYKKMIEDIINNTSISLTDIFDYETSPLKDEFNFNFKFYLEALQRHVDYGINPSLLFYTNNFSQNAAAGKENGYYIIQIHLGLMKHLIERFREKSDLLVGTENDEYIEFESSINVTVHELMYQSALHFTFYHEMAHLIQKSELLTTKLYEHTESVIEYSDLKHLLELDADKFSSLCIGAHILGFLDTNFGSTLTKEQLEKTLILICSSALFYILSFQTNKVDIYYKENTHPHPIIRVTCIIFNIVEYIRQSLSRKGYSFVINTNEVAVKCIDFSNKLSIHKFESNLIEDYRNILSSEIRNIIEYIKEFRVYEESDKSLASYKWNLKIQNTTLVKRKNNKGTKRTNKQIVEYWQKRKRSKRKRIKRSKRKKK